MQSGTTRAEAGGPGLDLAARSRDNRAPGEACAGAGPAAERGQLRVFGPSPPWRLLSWRELWQHRELVWMLGVRDLKVRYRQALVGIAWVVIHPLAMGIVLVLFFELIGRQPSQEGIPNPLIIISGLLLWQLFASIVSHGSVSLVGNQYLISKVSFPRLILPLATVLPNLVDFAIGLLLPAGLMAYYGIAPSWNLVFLPAFVLLAVAAGLALGIWFSALNAMYRDAGYLATVLLQIGFFTSPVVYSTRAVIPARWQAVIALNPMVGALEGIRWSLFGVDTLPRATLLISVATTAVLLLSGLVYFRRIEGVIADRI